jgi:ABC-2 type transport system permease protein
VNPLGKTLKYAAVGRVTLRNHFAYIADFLVRSLFLLLILYIFMQLWRVTFHGEGTPTIAGYSFRQMIWYLILTEAVTLACPSLCTKIEEEVKNGDVGYRLTRPISYIGFHYVSYMSEVAVRFAVNLSIGGVLGVSVLGWPSFGWGGLALFAVAAGAFTVNYFLNMMLALCAFWVEETRGLEFVYHKLLFTIGGMLMPLEMFPSVLQKVCGWLPFQAVLYFPAKAAVRFDAAALPGMLALQWMWAAVLAAAVLLIYGKGVKKLNVNGG